MAHLDKMKNTLQLHIEFAIHELALYNLKTLKLSAKMLHVVRMQHTNTTQNSVISNLSRNGSKKSGTRVYRQLAVAHYFFQPTVINSVKHIKSREKFANLTENSVTVQNAYVNPFDMYHLPYNNPYFSNCNYDVGIRNARDKFLQSRYIYKRN